MATSGTILSLSARRPSRKPSDGGRWRKQASSGSGGKAARARPMARRDRRPRDRAPLARAPPASTDRPPPPRPTSSTLSLGPAELISRDGIPEYRRCPARGTCAKGVTQVYCSTWKHPVRLGVFLERAIMDDKLGKWWKIVQRRWNFSILALDYATMFA